MSHKGSLSQAAGYFGSLAAGGFRMTLLPTLKLIGERVKAEAEGEVGYYQTAIGPFPATAQLAEATLERKARAGEGKGGSPDTPLWASGAYAESIETHIDPVQLTVEIGSNEPQVVYLELGTANMPARALFAPAALRVLPALKNTVRAAAVAGIASGVWSSLTPVAVSQAGGTSSKVFVP